MWRGKAVRGDKGIQSGGPGRTCGPELEDCPGSGESGRLERGSCLRRDGDGARGRGGADPGDGSSEARQRGGNEGTAGAQAPVRRRGPPGAGQPQEAVCGAGGHGRPVVGRRRRGLGSSRSLFLLVIVVVALLLVFPPLLLLLRSLLLILRVIAAASKAHARGQLGGCIGGSSAAAPLAQCCSKQDEVGANEAAPDEAAAERSNSLEQKVLGGLGVRRARHLCQDREVAPEASRRDRCAAVKQRREEPVAMSARRRMCSVGPEGGTPNDELDEVVEALCHRSAGGHIAATRERHLPERVVELRHEAARGGLVDERKEPRNLVLHASRHLATYAKREHRA